MVWDKRFKISIMITMKNILKIFGITILMAYMISLSVFSWKEKNRLDQVGMQTIINETALEVFIGAMSLENQNAFLTEVHTRLEATTTPETK